MRGRPELAMFALALVCLAAVALPFARCGGREGEPATAAGAPVLRQDDPEELAEEMARRYFSYDGDFEAWRGRVLELATEPLRSRVAAMPPDPQMAVYRITVRVLAAETTSWRRQGDEGQATVRIRIRGEPRAPGGEWSAPREAERVLLADLRREEGRWLVAEMRYLQ